MNEAKVKTTDQNDNTLYDQSSRAEAVLDSILHSESEAQSTENEAEDAEVSVDDELNARPILDTDTGRDKSRVLFVTADENVLAEGSVSAREYLDLADVFDEVHVLVLIPRTRKDGYTRPATNIWFYKVHGAGWQSLPSAALQFAKEALTWNGAVRPDIVVGIDPFEAGLAAYEIAKSFGRPLQLHVKTDFQDDRFLNLSEENKDRKKMADKLLRQVGSVRVKTAVQKKKLEEKYRKITDLKILPRFYNFAGLREAVPSFNLHEKYPGFAFIMLTFGPLTADSHLHDVFTALHRLLLNSSIGLIVVGDGPGRNLFLEKVKLLGIEKSVVFLKQADDLVSLLKTSDLFIETATSEDGEVRVLQAASCGAAIAAYETDLRKDLFDDGKSAFLCPPSDIQCLGQKVSQFINTPALRTEFRELVTNVAENRLEENEGAYFKAFRDTIEGVLVSPTTAKERQQNISGAGTSE